MLTKEYDRIFLGIPYYKPSIWVVPPLSMIVRYYMFHYHSNDRTIVMLVYHLKPIKSHLNPIKSPFVDGGTSTFQAIIEPLHIVKIDI